MIFTYFHFAADEELTRAVIDSGAVASRTRRWSSPSGELPLLTPMSEVAGRMAVQEGAKYLEKVYGGRGILLGGVPGVAPGEVVILGGGVVGINAAKMAAGLGAHVTILDISLDRLRYLDDVLPGQRGHRLLQPPQHPRAIRRADLVIGAVLLPGAKAPHLVKRADLKLMKPGSVIVDVAVDQGGCVETIKPTTHENPTYFVDGILHYAVANMPGGVPRTSTLALTNATLPYGLKLAKQGLACRLQSRSGVAAGAQRGRGQGGLSRGRRGVPPPPDRRRHRPLIQVLLTRLPHGEGLPLPSLATPGSAGYDLASAEAGVLAPHGAAAVRAPGSPSRCPRATSARSGRGRAWRSSTASPCPTRRPRSTATTAASSRSSW